MDFYEELKKRDLLTLLSLAAYKKPYYEGWGKVKPFLVDIVLNNRSVLIYGDYDADGLMCILTIRDGLDYFNLTKLDVFPYTNRTHNLDKRAAQQCIQGHYDYFIVCDTGSSDKGQLDAIVRYGTKIILLDHHQTLLSYEDYQEEIAVINTTIENSLGGEFKLSAGALCYTVMDLLFDVMCVKGNSSIAAYAAISLFADCMDMRNTLNRAIYYQAKALGREELPDRILAFLNKYSAFNARFIGFWFSPRINAMFRAEKLDILNDYFFSDAIDFVKRGKCFEHINAIYEEKREMIGTLVDILEVTELDNFIIADLLSAEQYVSTEMELLCNYTGLVANKLSEQYKKTAVVHCRLDNKYKGSVRDLYGRCYLGMFQQLCDAGGHGAAFGFHVNALDFQEFMYSIRRIDKHFALEDIENEPIIIPCKSLLPDAGLIEDIAQYNEFNGTNVPSVLLSKQIIGAMREHKTDWNYKYSWGDYYLQSNYRLGFGSTVLVKPIRSGSTKLLVQ